MALANYAASALGEKTAYLELDGHGGMTHYKPTGEKGYFIQAGVHYYPEMKKEEIPILLNCEYEKIIMDFGDSYMSHREELLRCDRKIFLLNLNPWQEYAAKKLVYTVLSEGWGNIKPLYAGVNAQKAVKEAVERECRIDIMELPLIPNPMCIRSEEFFCMDFMLGGFAAKSKRRNTRIPIKRKR